MTIPDFQTIMLPLLKHISDGNEHTNKEITEALADYFQLTQEDAPAKSLLQAVLWF